MKIRLQTHCESYRPKAAAGLPGKNCIPSSNECNLSISLDDRRGLTDIESCVVDSVLVVSQRVSGKTK